MTITEQIKEQLAARLAEIDGAIQPLEAERVDIRRMLGFAVADRERPRHQHTKAVRDGRGSPYGAPALILQLLKANTGLSTREVAAAFPRFKFGYVQVTLSRLRSGGLVTLRDSKWNAA